MTESVDVEVLLAELGRRVACIDIAAGSHHRCVTVSNPLPTRRFFADTVTRALQAAVAAANEGWESCPCCRGGGRHSGNGITDRYLPYSCEVCGGEGTVVGTPSAPRCRSAVFT